MAAVLAVAADNLQFVDSAEMLAFFDKFPVELHHHGSLNSQKHIFEEHARLLEVKDYQDTVIINFCDFSWTMTSRGHCFSKWENSGGHFLRMNCCGHFW